MLHNQTVQPDTANNPNIIEPDAEEFLSRNVQFIKTQSMMENSTKSSMDNKIKVYLFIVVSTITAISILAVCLQYAKFDNTIRSLKLSKSESNLRETIRFMRQRPAFYRNRVVQQPNDQVPSPQAYFAYRLYLNPTDQEYLDAEYYYYNSIYKFDAVENQLPMCIISAGRNLNTHKQRYKLFLDSINRQNYSNFKLIYTDDGSDDGTPEAFKAYLTSTHPILSFKTKIIENKQRKYALYNKDLMIKRECTQGDIIIDIDADDELIGRQALKVYNSLYLNNPDMWLLFSNNINFYEEYKQPLKGASTAIKPQFFKTKRLRIQPFRIMHLRSFRKEAFAKIPTDYFIDKDTHEYHKHISDGFIYIALAELSGSNRVKYIQQIFYYYYREHRSTNAQQKKKCSLQLKLQIPFQPLASIHDIPKRANITYPQSKIDRITKRNQHVYGLLSNYQKLQQFDTLTDYEFKQDPNYQNYIQSRFSIPPSLRQPNQILHKQLMKKVYFTYNMQKQYDSKDGNLAQYYYFNKNYQIGKFIKQQQICIVSFNNEKQFFKQQNYQKFLDSIARQNYTNYNIFLIDSYQNEKIKLMQPMKKYIKTNFPWMKIKYINREEYINKNAEVDKIIRFSCSQYSLVILLNSLSELVGRQTLKLINAKFYGKQTQICYSHSYALTDIQSRYQKQPKLIYSNGKKQMNQFLKGELLNWQAPHLLGFRKEAYLNIINQSAVRSLSHDWIKFLLISKIDQRETDIIEQVLVYVKYQYTPLAYSSYIGMCENLGIKCPVVGKQTVQNKQGDIGEQNKSKR